MLKQICVLCISLSTFHVALRGDSPGEMEFSSSSIEAPLPISPQEGLQSPSIISDHTHPQSMEENVSARKPRIKEVFHPFTGKIKGKKVRLRLQPDTDSAIVRELSRGEFIAVVGETDDFWVVEPTYDLKSYVFRSFVLDGCIEGNRVNVRLKPNMESPIVTHLNSGDPVLNSTISTENNKWVEFPMPSSVRLYVSKDFVDNVGGPEVKVQQENRLHQAKQQLETAHYFVENEMQKAYPDIDFDKMSHSFQIVVQEYNDFPSLAEEARESLSKMQEQYLDKRLAYLEHKAQEETRLASKAGANLLITQDPVTDKMRQWESTEEALYLTWFTGNDSKNMDEYYQEQRLTATKVSGILEAYAAPVKCKPGNYIVRFQDLPVAYVYSTVVNLDNFVGKQVTLIASPRPNNNFAFPAYFVFYAESQ